MGRLPMSTWSLLGVSWLLCLGAPASASDWPQLRGPGLDGKVKAPGTFDESFALETAWRRPVGPAYSSISIVGDRAVTLFSDGAQDVAAAFDVRDARRSSRRSRAFSRETPASKMSSLPRTPKPARRSAAGTFQLTAPLPFAFKQSIRMALAKEENLDKNRTDLVHEALNLLFEKYRVPVVDTTTAEAKEHAKD